MKKILFSLIALSAITFNACNNSNSGTAQNEVVNFYDVPLVCGAPPHIGCGSKAKPILLGLEKKNDVVKEAWLNREGTVIAIVWNENVSAELKTKTSDAIFKENKMDVTLLSENEHRKMLIDFEQKKNWYRGAEVDKLSMEEAAIIAERLVKRINAKTPLTKEKSGVLQQAITNNFKTTFKAINSTLNINTDEKKAMETYKQKFETEILEIGKKYLNETEMIALKDAIANGLTPTEDENKELKSCEKKNKDKCCKK